MKNSILTLSLCAILGACAQDPHEGPPSGPPPSGGTGGGMGGSSGGSGGSSGGTETWGARPAGTDCIEFNPLYCEGPNPMLVGDGTVEGITSWNQGPTLSKNSRGWYEYCRRGSGTQEVRMTLRGCNNSSNVCPGGATWANYGCVEPRPNLGPIDYCAPLSGPGDGLTEPGSCNFKWEFTGGELSPRGNQ